ncbi:uncharacterized protein ARMOST_08355 [Armillaria ostoyae]|uniref:Uncharacterized protein n=1 Tax=Armillaria ostoyae TaxID=47428 RepID=A0A284R8F1_ARMOS|nr:uncharacterized protein ARMOST_08355 [Armillaria ostoyae]
MYLTCKLYFLLCVIAAVTASPSESGQEGSTEFCDGVRCTEISP